MRLTHCAGYQFPFHFGGIGFGTVITWKVSDRMKATINGIAVEGTPQEIMEFQRLQIQKMGIKLNGPYDQTTNWQNMLKPMITSIGSGTAKSGCPNNGLACYCTGACKM